MSVGDYKVTLVPVSFTGVANKAGYLTRLLGVIVLSTNSLVAWRSGKVDVSDSWYDCCLTTATINSWTANLFRWKEQMYAISVIKLKRLKIHLLFLAQMILVTIAHSRAYQISWTKTARKTTKIVYSQGDGCSFLIRMLKRLLNEWTNYNSEHEFSKGRYNYKNP